MKAFGGDGVHPQLQQIPKDERYISSYATIIASCYTSNTLAASKLDPFHNLPVPSDLNASHMQQLFHDWFIVQAPRHFTVPRPEVIASELLHSPFLAPAFLDPVLALSIVTVSAAAQDKISSANKVLALTLLDRAMGMLRERVVLDGGNVTDLTIVAAIYIWAAEIYLADEDSLRQHAASVRALVDAREGVLVGCLGMSSRIAALFKWVDIMNSLHLNQPCQCPDDRVLAIPQSTTKRYGSFWDHDDTSTIDENVKVACKECCRSIELLECNDKDNMEPATYWYLYNRIAQLYQQTSKLRNQYRQSATVEECALFVVDIVKLLAFNGGQSQSGRRSLRVEADKLVVAVKAAGGSAFWQARIDLLLWIMFTIMVAIPRHEHRSWCTRVMRGAMEFKFGMRAMWVTGWKSELQTLLLSFGWSTISAFDSIDQICGDIWP